MNCPQVDMLWFLADRLATAVRVWARQRFVILGLLRLRGRARSRGGGGGLHGVS